MVWTTAADVVDAWIGSDAPTDLNQVDVWIGKAERLLMFRVPTLVARVTADEAGLLENVIDVVTSMVTRKFRNPEGIRQSNTTTGPFTESRTYGGDAPGELTLLDSELAMLAGSTGSGSGAFTIDMIPASSPFSPLYTYTDVVSL